MIHIIILIAGLLLAIGGAELLISGGVAIAKRFNIPMIVIASTVVALGTSLP